MTKKAETLTDASGVCCKTCRHYRDTTQAGEEPHGECRFGPPQVVFSDQDGPMSFFPAVEPDEDCGQHSPVLS